jgi:hypothetical protein
MGAILVYGGNNPVFVAEYDKFFAGYFFLLKRAPLQFVAQTNGIPRVGVRRDWIIVGG